MKFEVHPKAMCPCGSGKEYRKCHSPKRDQSDNNIWKGPGYNQVIYCGYKDPISGIDFDKAKKGVIGEHNTDYRQDNAINGIMSPEFPTKDHPREPEWDRL